MSRTVTLEVDGNDQTVELEFEVDPKLFDVLFAVVGESTYLGGEQLLDSAGELTIEQNAELFVAAMNELGFEVNKELVKEKMESLPKDL